MEINTYNYNRWPCSELSRFSQFRRPDFQPLGVPIRKNLSTNRWGSWWDCSNKLGNLKMIYSGTSIENHVPVYMKYRSQSSMHILSYSICISEHQYFVSASHIFVSPFEGPRWPATPKRKHMKLSKYSLNMSQWHVYKPHDFRWCNRMKSYKIILNPLTSPCFLAQIPWAHPFPWWTPIKSHKFTLLKSIWIP